MDKQTKQIENFLNLVSAHLFREDGANKYMQYLNASALAMDDREKRFALLYISLPNAVDEIYEMLGYQKLNPIWAEKFFPALKKRSCQC